MAKGTCGHHEQERDCRLALLLFFSFFFLLGAIGVDKIPHSHCYLMMCVSTSYVSISKCYQKQDRSYFEHKLKAGSLCQARIGRGSFGSLDLGISWEK